MAEQRHVRLFRNGRNQAVRIPVEFELPGDEAIMHRDGDLSGDRAGAASEDWSPCSRRLKPMDEEFFPRSTDPVPAPESVL